MFYNILIGLLLVYKYNNSFNYGKIIKPVKSPKK